MLWLKEAPFGDGLLRERADVRFAFIDAEKANFRPRLHRRPPPQFEAFEFANVLWVGDFGRLGTSTEARTA